MSVDDDDYNLISEFSDCRKLERAAGITESRLDTQMDMEIGEMG